MKTSGSKVIRQHTLCDDIDWRYIECVKSLDNEMIHEIPAQSTSTVRRDNITSHTVHAYGL